MSERKVLNKYYPPDFDPSKIPRMKLPRNRQYTVRLMAPFNMRCATCGEYIYKGKKFNARKEDVEGEDYLGIRIYRFYIKCTRCLQEISFKTDPRNTDYEIEAGATRNFMALKLAEEQAQREEDERKEDEATNPMKLLENRTKQSKQELELLESLEELRDLNRRQLSVDYDTMLSQFDSEGFKRKLQEKQEEEDEKLIKSVFGAKKVVVEEVIETVEEKGPLPAKNDVAEEHQYQPPMKMMKTSLTGKQQSSLIPQESQTKLAKEEMLAQTSKVKPAANSSWDRSVGALKKKNALLGLVRTKKSSSKEDRKPSEEKDAKPDKPCNESVDTQQNSNVKASTGLSLLGCYSGSDSE